MSTSLPENKLYNRAQQLTHVQQPDFTTKQVAPMEELDISFTQSLGVQIDSDEPSSSGDSDDDDDYSLPAEDLQSAWRNGYNRRKW